MVNSSSQPDKSSIPDDSDENPAETNDLQTNTVADVLNILENYNETARIRNIVDHRRFFWQIMSKIDTLETVNFADLKLLEAALRNIRTEVKFPINKLKETLEIYKHSHEGDLERSFLAQVMQFKNIDLIVICLRFYHNIWDDQFDENFYSIGDKTTPPSLLLLLILLLYRSNQGTTLREMGENDPRRAKLNQLVNLIAGSDYAAAPFLSLFPEELAELTPELSSNLMTVLNLSLEADNGGEMKIRIEEESHIDFVNQILGEARKILRKEVDKLSAWEQELFLDIVSFVLNCYGSTNQIADKEEVLDFLEKLKVSEGYKETHEERIKYLINKVKYDYLFKFNDKHIAGKVNSLKISMNNLKSYVADIMTFLNENKKPLTKLSVLVLEMILLLFLGGDLLFNDWIETTKLYRKLKGEEFIDLSNDRGIRIQNLDFEFFSDFSEDKIYELLQREQPVLEFIKSITIEGIKYSRSYEKGEVVYFTAPAEGRYINIRISDHIVDPGLLIGGAVSIPIDLYDDYLAMREGVIEEVKSIVTKEGITVSIGRIEGVIESLTSGYTLIQSPNGEYSLLNYNGNPTDLIVLHQGGKDLLIDLNNIPEEFKDKIVFLKEGESESSITFADEQYEFSEIIDEVAGIYEYKRSKNTNEIVFFNKVVINGRVVFIPLDRFLDKLVDAKFNTMYDFQERSLFEIKVVDGHDSIMIYSLPADVPVGLSIGNLLNALPSSIEGKDKSSFIIIFNSFEHAYEYSKYIRSENLKLPAKDRDVNKEAIKVLLPGSETSVYLIRSMDQETDGSSSVDLVFYDGQESLSNDDTLNKVFVEIERQGIRIRQVDLRGDALGQLSRKSLESIANIAENNIVQVEFDTWINFDKFINNLKILVESEKVNNLYIWLSHELESVVPSGHYKYEGAQDANSFNITQDNRLRFFKRGGFLGETFNSYAIPSTLP